MASVWLRAGAHVIGVDKSPSVLERANKGESHVPEPGVNDAFASGLATKRFEIYDDLEKASQRVVARPPLGLPFDCVIGAEHAVPDIDQDAEVVSPHVMMMVQVMHRPRHPEDHVGVLMLELMGVGRQGRVDERPRRPADARCQ